MRADSVGILDTLAILLLALEKLIEEESTGAGEALELVTLGDLETGRVEGRADCVGVQCKALSA